MKLAVGHFIKGLTLPTPTSVMTMIGVALGWAGVAYSAITPELIGSHAGYLANTPWDDYVFRSAKAFELSHAKPNDPVLLILGSSQQRQNFPLDARFFSPEFWRQESRRRTYEGLVHSQV